MEIKEQTSLSFHGVDIVNLHFQILGTKSGNIDVDVLCEPKVFYPFDDKSKFAIVMGLKIIGEGIFELNLQAFGNFEISNDVDEELRKQFVNVNAPPIMFPYIRSFVSTLTANIGGVIRPLTIPPHFFSGELEELKLDLTKENPEN